MKGLIFIGVLFRGENNMTKWDENLKGCKCGDNCLNLGCGNKPFKSMDGIDIKNFGQKYICDIDKDKWPIPDNTYDGIHAWNILEHIKNKIHVMNEAFRVLKPNGIIEIVVPDIARKIELAVSDPTHVSFWVMGTFTEYFCGQRPGGSDYDMKKWKMVESRHYDELNDNLLFIRMQKPL